MAHREAEPSNQSLGPEHHVSVGDLKEMKWIEVGETTKVRQDFVISACSSDICLSKLCQIITTLSWVGSENWEALTVVRQGGRMVLKRVSLEYEAKTGQR